MGKFNQLPGIEVNIADGGLILPEDASTESILIIAPSYEPNAPEEPVGARESADLITYGFGGFIGPDGRVNPIAAAWKAAFDGGCRQIYLMSLKGATEKEQFSYLQEKLFGILADFNVAHVALVGAYSDKDAEGIKATDFINVEDQAAFPGVPGIMRYAFAAKGAAINTPIDIVATTADTVILKLAADVTITLPAKKYDGTNGKTVQDLAKDVTAAFAAAGAEVANFKAEIQEGKLVILGDKAFTVKDGTALTALKLTKGAVAVKESNASGVIYNGSFAKLLGDYAVVQTENHSSVVTHISPKAPASNTLTAVKSYVDALIAANNDFSGYVQVAAGPVFGYNIPGYNGLFYTDGDLSLNAVTYAALVSTLRAESATTNKNVYGVAGLWFQLSLRQLNALTGKKYVTFRLKNGRVTVTDGCTTAPDLVSSGQKRPSDFARLSTLRITSTTAQVIRATCEPFIGEPNRMPQYNALNAAIKGALEAMKTQGALMDYRFSVVARGGTLNEAIVTLEIVPAFEMRKITINLSLRPTI